MAVDLELGVDTAVSPSLHPQVIASLDLYDESTAGHLEPAVEAFRFAYESLSNLNAAKEAVKGDSTMTPDAQVLRTADHAEKLYKDAAGRFDKVTANMQSGIAKVEADLNAPMQARAAHTIATEIRAYARSMDSTKLHAFIRQAIVNGDEVTASSILASPPYLSGLTPELQQLYTRMWNEQTSPAMTKRLKAMQGALELLGTNAPLLLKEVDRAIGAPPAKVKQLREARARADKAFAR